MKLPKLPSGWSEVTISMYQKLFTVWKMFKKEEVPGDLDRNVIACLAGISIHEIEKLKMSDIMEMKRHIAWAYDEIPNKKVPLEFDHNGKHYKVIIYSDGLTGQQHRDILTLKSTGGQVIDYTDLRWNIIGNEDCVYHMHELLAINCVPKNDKGAYEYTGYPKVAEEFLELPMTIAFPLYLFFSNVGKTFSRSIETYFLKKSRKNLKKLRKELKNLKREEMVS